jgi:hypothetical protein
VRTIREKQQKELQIEAQKSLEKQRQKEVLKKIEAAKKILNSD